LQSINPIIMKKFLTFLTFLLPMVLLAGGQHPPRPGRWPGPPPGLPVDQYLIILFGIALLLFVIFKNKLRFSK